MPTRIQRKRTKGWRMPGGAVSVTRPGKWGNPFAVGGWYRMGDGGGGMTYTQCLVLEPQFMVGHTKITSPAMAVEWFRRYRTIYPPRDIAELRGKDLACWCPLVDKYGKPVPCHADVLLEIANREAK